MNCEFCGNILKDKKRLYEHQKNAKYCLKLRGLKFICKYCTLEFNSEILLSRHICREKMLEQEKEIKKLKTTINTLRARLTRLKGKDKIKPIIELSLFPDSDEIDKIVKNCFTIRHFLSGVKGIVNFCIENLFNHNGKPTYVCTDTSRKIFRYMTNRGEFRDIKSRNLLSYLNPAMRIKAYEYYDKIIEKYDSYSNGSIPEEIDKEHTDAIQAMLIYTCIYDKKNEISSEFICKLTSKNPSLILNEND